MTLTPYANAEQDFTEKQKRSQEAAARSRDQIVHIANLDREKAAADAANELILEAMAEEQAEGREYCGAALTDISALDAEISQAQRVSEKMQAVARRKGKLMVDASATLLTAQRRACVSAMKKMGFPVNGRASFKSVAHLTLVDLADVAQLDAWANQSELSLLRIFQQIDAPDWTQIDARERAFTAARREGADGE